MKRLNIESIYITKEEEMYMSSPVLIEIKSRYPQMNEAMRRIADYVISSESDII